MTPEEVGESLAQPAPILQLALPDRLHPPAERRQGLAAPLVPRPVPRHLADPVVMVGLGDPGASRAVVAVPEAAVDEERQFAARHDDVGLSWQVRPMQAIAGAER